MKKLRAPRVSHVLGLIASVFALLFAASVGAGCKQFNAATAAPTPQYVQADRATYNAIAPAHQAYVTNDSSLDELQKQRRYDLLTTWRKRVEAAEKNVPPTPTTQPAAPSTGPPSSAGDR
jgi:hypothetical protein